MRIAFLADIHSNLEALTACLAAAREQRAERFVFLGDIVGYGADPNACINLVEAECDRGALAVRGNHDEAALGRHAGLAPAAAVAAIWTDAMLTPKERAFLSTLPLTIADDDHLYVHASACRPDAYPYVSDVQLASESLRATTARLTVCGHVHVPALYHITTVWKVMGFTPKTSIPIPLSTNRRWLAVMGSVGQPRDGNPAAAFGIYDTKTSELSYLRTPYDIEKAASKIQSAGLPDSLWQRLYVGC